MRFETNDVTGVCPDGKPGSSDKYDLCNVDERGSWQAYSFDEGSIRGVEDEQVRRVNDVERQNGCGLAVERTPCPLDRPRTGKSYAGVSHQDSLAVLDADDNSTSGAAVLQREFAVAEFQRR